ncbi:RNA methyltransferase, partial [Candidatus Fermentibacteria bacterium]
SRGTHATVPWRWFESSVAAVKAAAPGREIIAVENTPDAMPLHQASFSPSAAFILGNEAEGVSKEALELSAARIIIPQSGTRQCINVSSTAAVIAWEIQRRRLTGEFDNA